MYWRKIRRSEDSPSERPQSSATLCGSIYSHDTWSRGEVPCNTLAEGDYDEVSGTSTVLCKLRAGNLCARGYSHLIAGCNFLLHRVNCHKVMGHTVGDGVKRLCLHRRTCAAYCHNRSARQREGFTRVSAQALVVTPHLQAGGCWGYNVRVSQSTWIFNRPIIS